MYKLCLFTWYKVKYIFGGCRPLPGLCFVTDYVFDVDRISGCSQEEESVWTGDVRITSLLYADDVVLIASSCTLACTGGYFEAMCEEVGM